MEINKITFESFKTNDVTQSFEDLDVNGDGKITQDDLNATKNSGLKSQIQSLLNAADDEPSLSKAGAKNSYGVNETDTANFANDVENSKGTVYVVMGNLPGCGRCVNLENQIKERLGELEAKAQVFNMQWNDNNDKCWALYQQISKNTGSVGFPVVLKFVDGKLTELISEGSANYSKVVQTMIDKAEGTNEAGDAGETGDAGKTGGTTDAAKTGTTTAKTAEDIKKAADDLKAKYPPAATAEDFDPYTSNNPSLAALKKAMDEGAIAALGEQGFSRIDIVDIISQAYPSIGIKKNDKGGYDCPMGRDAAGKEIYNMFIDQLSKISTPNAATIAQVKELNVQILANNAKLTDLKAAIELVQKEVQEIVEEAIRESENIAEDQKDESARIVREEMDKYASSGGEVTYADFQKSLENRLNDLDTDGSIKLASTISKLIHAESKMSTLKGYIDSFSSLVDENKTLADKVDALKNTPQEDPEPCDPTRCDPIGFSVNGKRYDFFVDKDNNNDLSNEKEFLGAENGWAEMKALDTDNDGKVTQAEMKDLKLVTTDDAGNQVIKNASEVFGATDSVDLNSYKSVNQDFENGNTLLGTFSMTVGGQEVNDAYNTMDTLTWLDENYDFTDEAAGTGRFGKENTTPEDILRFEKERDAFNATYAELETNLGTAWGKYGITRADVVDTIQTAAKEAESTEAKAIEELFKKKQKAASTEAPAEETPAEETPAEETPPAAE